jgi:hypothetical protein
LNNQNNKKFSFTSDTTVLIYLSAAYVIIHLIFINQYSYFRDELYYIACGNHLAFGYVDQPPFVALIAFFTTRVFGDSLLAIRIFSVLAGAVTVYITGSITKDAGGSGFAQILSVIMVIIAPVYLFMFHYLSMNSFDIMFWAIAFYLLVRIVKKGNSKLWIWFGIAVGIGLQNKISIFFLLIGLAAGLILTPNRKYLKDKIFWLGALIASIIFLPYIIWETSNGIPTIEFMRNASTLKNAPLSPIQFITGQMLDMHPVSFLFSICTVYYLFFTKTGKPFRIFGWLYLAIFVFLMFTKAKVYYLSPAYPIMFVFGALSVENFIIRFNQRWIKSVSIAILVMLGAITAPLALPSLPVEDFIKYSNTLGVTPEAGENSRIGVLPQHFADMFGWENMAEQVVKVYNTLSPEEQKHCSIFAHNYGEAGAIDFFGKKYGLPNAICGHNSYWHWGYDSTRSEVLIVIGGKTEDHLQTFSDVKTAGLIINEYAMPYESDLPIFICKGLKVDFDKVWQKIRFYI